MPEGVGYGSGKRSIRKSFAGANASATVTGRKTKKARKLVRRMAGGK